MKSTNILKIAILKKTETELWVLIIRLQEKKIRGNIKMLFIRGRKCDILIITILFS